ncbi:MAG: hypothetical protein EB100_03335, partial [Crocinitomicaceae bacterium]|nr:hypothetical protein [Crocinitomicaceae bacterium]
MGSSQTYISILINSIKNFIFICTTLITIAGSLSAQEKDLVFPIQKTLDPSQSGNQRFDLGDPTKVEKTIVYDPV